MPNGQKFGMKGLLPSYFTHKLAGLYDEREAKSLARLVLEDMTGKSSAALLIGDDSNWSRDEEARIDNILNKLREGDPIQYIMGYTEFFGLKFSLGPGVLIPRNETEELVEWILSDETNHSDGCRILDIGCGTGAISVTLSKNLPVARIFAIDISEVALEYSVTNAEKLGAAMVCGSMDILSPSGFFAEMEYDVIVSNPPYVLESQKPFLEKRVTEREPSMALFVPDTDPMLFYRAIADFASQRLSEEGRLYVEINEQLSAETLREFDRRFSKTELRKDIHGKYRMIKATNGQK